MKKLTVLFAILIVMMLISACSVNSGTHTIPSSQEETIDNNFIYEQHIGTWYGFGTDGEDAQFQININPKDSKTAYVSIIGWGDNIRAGREDIEIVFSSPNDAQEVTNEPRKRKFCFSTVSGKETIEIDVIDASTGNIVAQTMPAGKYPARSMSFGEPKPISEPTPAPTPEPDHPDYTYEKDAFVQRYNQLNSRAVEEGPQQTMNVESGELFSDWDDLLNDVYQYLKTIKSSSEFESIKNDEIAWIKQKEAAIEQSANEFYGGSMAPLVANMTAIEYTKQRCEYLISLIY